MITWDKFLPDILPYVPGCPIPLIEHELLRTAQDFFYKTRAWAVNLPAIPVLANATTVPIVLPDTTTELVRIERAWYDTYKMTVRTVDTIDNYYTDNWMLHTGCPTELIQISPDVVQLYPIPLDNAVTGLTLRVSVRPNETATGINDDMVARFREAFIAGAMSRLMLQPAKPWTNDNKGMLLEARYEELAATALLLVSKSYGRGRVRAFPTWA